MNSIYAEYFMVYLLSVQAAGVSALFLWHDRGGVSSTAEVVGPAPTMLTPYSRGHASTRLLGGGQVVTPATSSSSPEMFPA